MDESLFKPTFMPNIFPSLLRSYRIVTKMSFNNTDFPVFTYPMRYVRTLKDTGHFSFRIMDKATYLQILRENTLTPETRSFISPVNVGYQFKAKPDQKVFPDDQEMQPKAWYNVTFRVKPWEMETDDCDVKDGRWAQIISVEECEDPNAQFVEVETPVAAKNVKKVAAGGKNRA